MLVRVALSPIVTLLFFILILASTASAENVLRWTSQGDALTLDPHSQNEAPTIAMSGSMYERLVNRDPGMALVPELAVSWKTISPTI